MRDPWHERVGVRSQDQRRVGGRVHENGALAPVQLLVGIGRVRAQVRRHRRLRLESRVRLGWRALRAAGARILRQSAGFLEEKKHNIIYLSPVFFKYSIVQYTVPIVNLLHDQSPANIQYNILSMKQVLRSF